MTPIFLVFLEVKEQSIYQNDQVDKLGSQ